MIRKAWAAYAAVITTAVLIGEVNTVMHTGEISARTFANWFVTAILLIGTWCYALEKPISTERYWRVAFWLVLFASAVPLVPAALAGRHALFMLAVTLPILAPAFVAMYLYGHRSPHIWHAGDVTA
jgi:hypothetical protein